MEVVNVASTQIKPPYPKTAAVISRYCMTTYTLYTCTVCSKSYFNASLLHWWYMEQAPYPVAIVLGSTLLSLKRKGLRNVTSTSLINGLPAMKQRTTSDSNLSKSNIALLLSGFTTAIEAGESSGIMGRYRLRIMLRSLASDRSSGLLENRASAMENSLTSTLRGADCSQQAKGEPLL